MSGTWTCPHCKWRYPMSVTGCGCQIPRTFVRAPAVQQNKEYNDLIWYVTTGILTTHTAQKYCALFGLDYTVLQTLRPDLFPTAGSIPNNPSKGGSELPLISVEHDTEIDIFEITSKFDPTLIALIKGSVPSSNRTWDPETKKWSVDDVAWKVLRPILEGALYKIDLIEKKRAHSWNPEDFFYNTTSTPQTESAATIKTKLIAILGADITNLDERELKKLYRQKARELHPDFAPGRESEMSELNRLWALYNAKELVLV